MEGENKELKWNSQVTKEGEVKMVELYEYKGGVHRCLEEHEHSA